MQRNRFLNSLSQTNDLIVRIAKALGVVLMLSVLLLMFLQVAARFLFSSPFPWAEELARYSYVWLVFVASVSVAYERSHIAVHLFDEKLPRSVRTLLNSGASLVVGAACIGLCIGSVSWIRQVSAGASPALGIPSEVLYGVVWAGILGIGLYSIRSSIVIAIGADPKKNAGFVEEIMEEGAG